MLLKKSTLKDNPAIQITGSKSISNRLLILEKLFGNIEIRNLSNSQDTELMQNALHSDSEIIDIHHAGTAMRFLTSYFAIQENKTTVLTGSERMKQRPVKFLVDALKDLGAEIEYLENEGFPPLKITGKKLKKNSVKIPANISSQFISSLLLIGGKLENGLEIELTGEITSRPYLEMTLKIMKDVGIESEFNGNLIRILKKSKEKSLLWGLGAEVESDWSSASYFYSLSAIGRKNIHLKSFKSDSLQGDSVLQKIYADFFGIQTVFNEKENIISLIPDENFQFPKIIKLDMNDCPDIAQTLCVTASALKIPFEITGLKTLKIKETDRLTALQNELKKIGCKTEITENLIRSIQFSEPDENISIATYNDHRMAMSFAPFCLIKELNIENESVVEKSYPEFWKDFESITE
ncbi:MAG: 3-phosphoshikimate 1-carboxyvinyltransferase [Bergeyella sp.]